MKIAFLLLLAFSSVFGWGQKETMRTFRVTDRQNPVAFASIVNLNSDAGTITNSDGKFALACEIGDSIRINHIGYITKTIGVKTQNENVIELTRKVVLLTEVPVYDNNDYLYALIKKVRKKYNMLQIINPSKKAKTYFQLKSTHNDTLAEFFEAFYNGDFTAYVINNMNFVKGRMGIKPIDNINYISTETSKVFNDFNLFKQSDRFPLNPFCVKTSELEASFTLTLDNVFQSYSHNIYVLSFKPLTDDFHSFAGKVWINVDKSTIEKIVLMIDDAKIHPFIPFGSFKKISETNLTIDVTYDNSDKRPYLKQFYFDYQLIMADSVGENHLFETSAHLIPYEYESCFNEPLFAFSKSPFQDYRNVLATPYDTVFWSSVKGFSLNTEGDVINEYLANNATIESKTLSTATEQSQISDMAYVRWAKDPLVFGNLYSSSHEKPFAETRFEYNIDAKIYLEYLFVGNRLKINTYSLIDPVNTYYNDTLNQRAKDFINLYFDLVEIQRRCLQDEIQQMENRDYQAVEKLYDRHTFKLSLALEKFVTEVKCGENFRQLEKWKSKVRRQLQAKTHNYNY
ncbi:MAG: carboxypeptidase-like regulatory domain-containing protein [Salinivirgaceae bacterium]